MVELVAVQLRLYKWLIFGVAIIHQKIAEINELRFLKQNIAIS